VPYRLAFWPPPPKDQIYFHFCWQNKVMVDVERDPLFPLCVRVPLQTSPGPGKSSKSGGEVPVQRLHRPIRHNCHTSANTLICKQIIILCGCWDGRGEDVSDPQVVHKPHQPTGTLASHQPVSLSLHTTALGLIVVFLPSKKSQIWKILISFLLLFGKKWFILIEPKGWLSHWNI